MRGTSVVVVGCLAPLTGCHLYQNAARVLVNEPVLYLDEHKLRKDLHKDARHAWAEVCRQYPKRTFTDDFVEGFCDGYVDYLDNGGTAQLPAEPPLRYRRTKFLNPEGHERIRQYFLGFKYGMDVAIATGCRTFMTYPVVLPELPPPVDPNITVLPPPPDTSVPLLPVPRPVTPTPPGGGTEPKVPPKDPDSVKPPDKDKSPAEPISVPIPVPVPETAGPTLPPAGGEPAAEPPRPRPLFPAATPTGPLFDLPPPRPPVWGGPAR
jgi:hypothetical protein